MCNGYEDALVYCICIYTFYVIHLYILPFSMLEDYFIMNIPKRLEF